MPLTVDVSVTRSGEVALVGTGQAVTGGEIVHGTGTEGVLDVVSQTAVPVTLTVQDVGKPAGFEERLWVHITVDDTGSSTAPARRCATPPRRRYGWIRDRRRDCT